ncbi:MAG: hypothetical protein ACRBG0_01895 [Lewinella sp.]|jgi:hypothetical protein|uniref:hypothetical protein n=1 Tax=Lewinella sp. TaxID=2004506 RepID=UPI003D6BAF70
MRFLLLIITIVALFCPSVANTAPHPYAYFEVAVHLDDDAIIRGYVICENFTEEYSDEDFTNWLIKQSDYSGYDSLRVRHQQHFFEHPDGISAAIPYCESYQDILSSSIVIVKKKRMVPTCWQSVYDKLSAATIDFLSTSPVTKERLVVEGPAAAINYYMGDFQQDYWLLSYHQGQDLNVIQEAVKQELYESIVGCEAEEIVIIWDLIFCRYRKILLLNDIIFLKLEGF